MPLPTPNKNQSQDSFIKSCMSSEVMKKEFPNNKQRQAVCFSQYHKKKSKANIEPKWDEFEVEIQKNGFLILPD